MTNGHLAVGLIMVSLLATSTAAQAQTLIKNPRQIEFECPDHALDNEHEVSIYRASDGRLMGVLLVGDPPADEQGVVRATLNVQPTAFGEYWFTVRIVAPTVDGGVVRSVDSPRSDNWERAPGAPTKPRVGQE